MMENRYYFSIRYLPEHADNELLAGRCISTMHGFMSQERNNRFKNSVGISFFNWTELSVGNEISFVSTHRDILTGLSFQPYLSTMINEGVFDISEIREVPGSGVEAQFVFNKTIQKIFIASKKRRVKRAINRAEAQGKSYIPIPNEEREFDLFHEIPVCSQSLGNEFILHIQRRFPEVLETGKVFNSYGFSSNDKWKGTVPIVSF